MHMPVITGLIKRRLLINFRADPDAVKRVLPSGFSPKLQESNAIVGVCLIRLEQVRPKGFPALVGIASENAAYRIAVEWTNPDGRPGQGVYIPRRDTNSLLNVFVGGRMFPGVHHHAHFATEDDGKIVSISVKPDDSAAEVEVSGIEGDSLPASSCFASLEDASAFFDQGCIGYSVSDVAGRLDGLKLETHHWEVRPLDVMNIHSGFFFDKRHFPKGTVEFDHGLVMRNVRHDWLALPPFKLSASYRKAGFVQDQSSVSQQ